MHRHRGGGPPRGPERRARVLWQQPEELQQGKEALAGLTYAWPGPGWWWRGAPAGRASFAAFDATPVPATLASASSGGPRARSRPSGSGVPPGPTTSPGPPGDPGCLRRGPRPPAARLLAPARPRAPSPRRSAAASICVQVDWLECFRRVKKQGATGREPCWCNSCWCNSAWGTPPPAPTSPAPPAPAGSHPTHRRRSVSRWTGWSVVRRVKQGVREAGEGRNRSRPTLLYAAKVPQGTSRPPGRRRIGGENSFVVPCLATELSQWSSVVSGG